ncbi:hypothetical protein INT43_004833 [Umbelopsis isabellina]|uniref:Choice-of-anchor A domain-containing protein n=1 Tax=Mortierella isabellina TaxID=91625 RepID=A0A8H7PFC9_MORIS|nr:hypothetical protein INT43_004833 [Umbelopsis isabellina]
MIVASYIFAVTTLVTTILADTQVVHKAVDFDLSEVNGFVQEPGLKLAEPKLANFLDASCQCNYTSERSWTQLLQFNAIVFGNFETFGSEDILGRLAVGGNLLAPGYVVNSNADAQCYGTNTVPWSQLALAVGGNILSPTTEVHGHWWTGSGGTAIEQNTGCNSPANVDQPFPFSAIQTLLNGYSQAYASMAPNLVLNDDNSIRDLGTLSSGCYNVITLRPCHNSNSNDCITQSNWSFSDHILLGQPNWNGPSNGYPNPNRLLIINVPVFNGETIAITTNQPSVGANNCNLIWNFYPADTNGNYLSAGSFTLIRNTGSPFQGVTLAPSGNILDGSQSVFQGVIFANSYRWNQLNGVEIHNTPSCLNYGFCVPPGQGSSPVVSLSATNSSAQTTTSAASTTPESSPTPPAYTQPASSVTLEFSASSAESTTTVMSSTASESSSSSSEISTTVSSSTSATSVSKIGVSHIAPILSVDTTQITSFTSVTSIGKAPFTIAAPSFTAVNTQISSSTSVTSIGKALNTIAAPSFTAGTTQISSSISNPAPLASDPVPSSASLIPGSASPSTDKCRRHQHHHKHDEYEKYDDEGHAWDNEKDYEHKSHQKFEDDWENNKHKHDDHQPQNADWDDDKHKSKDRQENNDDVDDGKHKHEEKQKNNDGWDNSKHKRGDSEDDGYWEDECEDDTHHYHDGDNDKYKGE